MASRQDVDIRIAKQYLAALCVLKSVCLYIERKIIRIDAEIFSRGYLCVVELLVIFYLLIYFLSFPSKYVLFY